MSTAISWTDETWNPVTGCTKVSAGCAHCYGERLNRRFPHDYVDGEPIPFSKVALHPDRLDRPLRWRKPRRVFVCSMGDLFHEDVPESFLLEAWMTMALSPEHTYQVLTKRPERMCEWVTSLQNLPGGHSLFASEMWPLPNVHLGVTAENQAMADERIPILLETPAAVRFVSCEPLLGPVDLRGWLDPGSVEANGPALDWVIVGGESGGPPERALVERCLCADRTGIYGCPRCHATGWMPKFKALEWVRSIRDQCAAAGVPFFFKQWGGPTPKAGGCLLDGREHKEMPEVRAWAGRTSASTVQALARQLTRPASGVKNILQDR